MAVETRFFEYDCDGMISEGFIASPGNDPAPGVLVGHAWAGQSNFERSIATKLAELGYCAIAYDVYGKGKRGNSMEENSALMAPLIEDRAMLQRRLKASLDAAKKQSEVDPDRVAGIGYCFGGLCMLDMARMGCDITGVVSFHGLLTPPDNLASLNIRAKVLVLHGWDDPMAPPADVMAFSEAFTNAKADWQLHAYGNAAHAFTKPDANMPDNGMMYDAKADNRSWQTLQNFLTELF